MKLKLTKHLLFSLSFQFLFPVAVFPQVSLSSDDLIDLPINGANYSVIRDGRDKNQWYYMPDMPRLVDKKEGETTVPEFTLLRYQYHNYINREKLVEGGFLQFAVTTQIPSDVFTRIKEYLISKYGNNIKLGSMIFKSAQVSAYTAVNPALNDSSTIIGSAGVGGGIAPIFSAQKMVFSFPYNKISTNVINTLISSQTGIPVFVTLNYWGLTPKSGLKVEWDWQLVYNHYSSDEKFKASASCFGRVGVSYEYNSQQIWNILRSDNSVRIYGITSEGLTQQVLDKILQPLLARINAEILDGLKPPEKVAPLVANNPLASGSVFAAGYSVSIKRVNEIKSGRGSFDFNVQNMVERTTIIGGVMRIDKYTKEVKDLVVVNSTEDDFKSASIILPSPISNELSNDLKVNKVDLSLSMVNNDQESDHQFVFSSLQTNHSWQDSSRSTRYFIVIPLMEDWTNSNGAFKNTAYFKEQMSITTDLNYTLNFEKKYKSYTSEGSINCLSDNRFNILEINPGFLEFKGIDNTQDIVQVTAQMTFDNNQTSMRTIQLIKENGQYLQPNSLKYIIPDINTINSVKLIVKYFYKDGTCKNWKYNNRNLKDIEIFKEGDVILQAQDIQ